MSKVPKKDTAPAGLAKVKSSKIDLTATARDPRNFPARAVALRLAKFGDPYVMADGKVIQPEHLFDKPDHVTEQIKSSKNYRPTRKRATRDLPAAPNVMKGVALVFTLTILGVSDREISDMLDITVSQVRQIRGHAAYGETFEIVSSEFVNAKSQRLVSRIAAYADDALDTVAEIAQTGKENNRLKASIDILDRAGVRPKDTAEMGKTQQNELRITIIKQDGSEADVRVGDVTID